jgi:hypothetical protein
VQYLAIARALSPSTDSARKSTVAKFKKIYSRSRRSGASG